MMMPIVRLALLWGAGVCLVLWARDVLGDRAPAHGVIVEHVTEKPRRTMEGLGTVGYSASKTEEPFFKKLADDEKTTYRPGSDYDITKKAGKYVGWFGIVREINEDSKSQQTILKVEHKYFDGFVDSHMMVLSFNGSGDFQAVLPGLGHRIEPLSLVRVYGKVSPPQGRSLPRVDTVFVRDWHWETFAFISAYGTQRDSEKWRKLNQVNLDQIYDQAPAEQYYRERLGDRPQDVKRKDAYHDRLLKAALALRPDAQALFTPAADAISHSDFARWDRILDEVYQARTFRPLAALLIAALKDAETVNRYEICCALNEMAELAAPVVPDLIALLGNPDPFVRAQLAQALGAIGPAAKLAVPALIEALKDKDAHVRANAVEAIGEIGVPIAEVVPALIRATSDEDDFVRFMAAGALGQLGHNALIAVEPLIRLLKNDRAKNSRWIAAEAIGKVDVDGRLSVPALVDAMRSPDKDVRRFAALGLAALGSKASPSLSALKRMLTDKDPGVQVACAKAIWKAGGSVKLSVAVLNAALLRNDRFGPMWAAEVVAEIGPPGIETLPALRKLLKHEHKYFAEKAATAIGRFGPAASAAIPDLTKELVHEEGAVRAAAAEALWNINHDPRAIQRLTNELKDVFHGAGRAAEAIGRIGAPAANAIPALEKLRYARDSFTRKAAIKALRKLDPTHS